MTPRLRYDRTSDGRTFTRSLGCVAETLIRKAAR